MMQIPIIKKLVEQYSLPQLQEAETATLEEQKPIITLEEKDEGECLTHVLAAIYIKKKQKKRRVL